MEKGVLEAIGQALVTALEENQKRANQYVVVYMDKRTDKRLGFHADTFCSLTQDIFRAKRYAGTEPEKQLSIIWKNFQSMIKSTEEEPGFLGIPLAVKNAYYKSVDAENVYIDVVELANGMPPQEFVAIIIDPNQDKANG